MWPSRGFILSLILQRASQSTDSLPQYLISWQEYQCHRISVFTTELLSPCGFPQREESKLSLQVKSKQGRCYPHPNAPLTSSRARVFWVGLLFKPRIRKSIRSICFDVSYLWGKNTNGWDEERGWRDGGSGTGGGGGERDNWMMTTLIRIISRYFELSSEQVQSSKQKVHGHPLPISPQISAILHKEKDAECQASPYKRQTIKGWNVHVCKDGRDSLGGGEERGFWIAFVYMYTGLRSFWNLMESDFPQSLWEPFKLMILITSALGTILALGICWRPFLGPWVVQKNLLINIEIEFIRTIMCFWAPPIFLYPDTVQNIKKVQNPWPQLIHYLVISQDFPIR